MCYAEFTKGLARLSKCKDKQVAAIIIDKEGTQVLSIGINGGPSKGPDCLCGSGKYTCIHAEANAIAKDKSTVVDKVMICTLSPCVTCASLIANNDIKQLYYIDDYKSNDGKNILTSLGIKVEKLGGV